MLERWEKDGYLIVPKLLDNSLIEKLRPICDAILDQWIKDSPVPAEASNSTNMAFLTEPCYFEEHPEWLPILLEAIADRKILEIIEEILDSPPLFHNTQYF